MRESRGLDLQRLAATKHQLALIVAMQQLLGRSRVPGSGLLCRWLTGLSYLLCACEIAPTATVPRSTRFAHPTGIVIGAGVRLGERVTIYQNVTLGSHGRPDRPQGYPRIGDDVVIYAGAVIVGDVAIGDRAVIGANTVVAVDVPADAVVLAPRPDIRTARG